MDTLETYFLKEIFSRNETQKIIYFEGDFLMKKTLAAAITSALVIGVAGTTFAAANPFSDVKADHWSFDAVAKLAQEGVIEGYGDNTFRGDSHITRYEMAQMVAKAMAKEEKVNKQQKAMIDKLAAEYAAELDNLGVRVSNLEEKIGNVSWGGKIRLRTEKDDAFSDHSRSQSYYELWAKAKVNEDWTATVELTGWRSMNGQERDIYTDYQYGDMDSNDTTVFVSGPLFGADAKIGKFDSWSYQGYVLDDAVRGAELQFGDKTKVQLTAGRVGGANSDYFFSNNIDTADYAAIDVQIPMGDKANFGLAYHKVSGQDVVSTYGTDEDNNIWTAGFDTKLGADWKFQGIYAKSSLDNQPDASGTKGYDARFIYKATDVKDAGSYSLWVGYNKIPTVTQVSSTAFRGWNTKGWEVGVGYVPTENVLLKAVYFDGEKLNAEGTDVTKFRAQAEFLF